MSLSLGSCSNNSVHNDIPQCFSFEGFFFFLFEEESKDQLELHCNINFH